MAIPSTQIIHVEWILYGAINAGGSNSKNTANVFHYRRTATGTTVSKTNFDSAAFNAVITALAPALNTRWSLSHTTVRFMDDASDAPTFFTHVTPGGVAGDSMPAMNTVYLLLKTALRGKHYRGNKKLGPLSEADTTLLGDDILNAAAITRWQAVATAIGNQFTDIGGLVWVPEVVSRKLSQLVVNPTNIVANDIIAVLLNKRIGRLKRREPKSVY